MRSTTKVMALVFAGGLVLAACGDDDSTASNDTATTRTTAEATTTTAAGSSGATVSVASGAIGDHLVAPDGHTLYLFEKDQGTTSACTGACEATWPALVAATPTGGAGIDASKLANADGQQPDQVVYNGHLLYEFAGDSAAGDTNGTKVPSWYAVDADGKAIEDD